MLSITSTLTLSSRCHEDSSLDLFRIRRSASPSTVANLTHYVFKNRSDESNPESEEKTLEACHPLYFLLDFFHQYYIPAIILLGLVGNLLSCIVFLNTYLRIRSSSYYLAALATADFGFLVTLLLVWLNNNLGWKVFNKDGWCETLVYVSAVCSSLSVWLIVAFTVERFIAVQYPLHRPYICTIARAKAIVLVLVILALASHSYSFVTAGVVLTREGEEYCDLKSEYMETMKIINIIDSIVSLIAPLVLIIVMNTMIMRNLLKFRKRFNQTPSACTDCPSRERSDINLNQIPGIHRPDMIQLMMDSRDKDGKRLSVDEMANQAFIFFLGGFDTTSIMMCLVAQIIATNPEVESKVLHEVKEAHRKIEEGQSTYDVLKDMTYMDAVIDETLRMYPIAAFLDRVCVKELELPPAKPGAKPITIKPGESIWFLPTGIHHDTKYYKDPENFRPERFLNGEILPNTYLPFGLGPRVCIGNRFAIMNAKILLCHLLKNCVIEPCEKTTVPLKFSRKTIMEIPDNGYWLNIRTKEIESAANGHVGNGKAIVA